MPAGNLARYVDHGWWPDVLHGLMPLLFLLVFVGFEVAAVLRPTGHGTPSAVSAAVTPPRSGGALEEVRLRYARGEMDRDQFIQLTRDLGGSAPAVEPTEPAAESGWT